MLRKPVLGESGSGVRIETDGSFAKVMGLHRGKEVLHEFGGAAPTADIIYPRVRTNLLHLRLEDDEGWIGISIEQHSSLPPIIAGDVVVVLSPGNEHRIDVLRAHKLLNLLFSFEIIDHFAP